MTAATDHARNADVLDDAADEIERKGWKQPGDDQLGVCAGNAIYHSGGPWIAAQQVFARQVGVDPHRTPMCIFAWNDAPGRTAQEVLDALRLAAKSERTRADAIDANDPSP